LLFLTKKTTMETIDNETNDLDGVKFSAQIKQNLKETAKWANFLAIVGFVMLGLIVIAALFMFGAGATIFGGGSVIAIGFGYLLMAALYFFPTYYLFLFARKIKLGLNSTIQSEVDEGFLNLKKLFKFTGILVVIMLSIYAIIILLAVIGGVASGF